MTEKEKILAARLYQQQQEWSRHRNYLDCRPILQFEDLSTTEQEEFLEKNKHLL